MVFDILAPREKIKMKSNWSSCECALCLSYWFYLEGLISTVGQHVSLEPTLTGGRGVIHLTTLP